METRIRFTLKTTLALAAAWAMTSALPAFAQTGAEYPRTMPGGGVPGGPYGGSSIGGGSISAPAPSGGGPSKTTVVPYGPDEPTPVTTTHHRTVRHIKSAPEDRSAVEPAQGHLKLVTNSYAYERPTSSSTRIQPVEAGKFVNVIGTSHYYAQVKLKNSEIAYVPLTAIALVNPTDKMFKLTADAAVLSTPNHAGSKIAEVHRGRDVHVVGIALNYMKIRMKDGKEGYIPIHALE
jgi:uncharacterized protein YgiM (DUF1202 family)